MDFYSAFGNFIMCVINMSVNKNNFFCYSSPKYNESDIECQIIS